MHAWQGMLGIGASMLGSPHVLGIDIDADALEVAITNADGFEGLTVRSCDAYCYEMGTTCCMYALARHVCVVMADCR